MRRKAKLKVNYTDAEEDVNLTVKLRLQKDSIIWLSGTVLGIPVVKGFITPTKVSYYSKIHKTYFEGDFSVVNRLLNADLDFNLFQNLLLGEGIIDLYKPKYRVFIANKKYLLVPEKHSQPDDGLVWINPQNFKIAREEIRDRSKNQLLTLSYEGYRKIESVFFPKKMILSATENVKTVIISVEYRSIAFDKALRFPFKIPEGYKKVENPFERKVGSQ